MKYIMILLLLTSQIFAAIGTVTAIRGDAKLIRSGAVEPVRKGTALEVHDQIKTAQGSKLQIVFNDKTVISLGQNSDFQVDDYLFTKKDVKAKFTVKKGFFKSITGKIGKIAPKRFKVKTANATIGVRGTTIVGETTPKLDIIACTQGQIVVTSDLGSVVVNQGERTIVSDVKAPTQAQKVNRILLKQLDMKTNPQVAPQQLPLTDTPVKNTTLPSETAEIKEKVETEVKEGQKIEEEQLAQNNPSDTETLEYIQSVTGTPTPVYEGKVVEGTTSHGTIKQNDLNHVRLGFDLGAGNVNGNIRFQDDIQTYDIDVAGHVKGDGSFEFNSQNGYDGNGKGALSGKQYENANGDFHFEEKEFFNLRKNIIEGKFETTRE